MGMPILQGQAMDDGFDTAIDVGVFGRRHKLGAIGRERDALGEEVAGEVHHHGQGEADVEAVGGVRIPYLQRLRTPVRSPRRRVVFRAFMALDLGGFGA